MMRCSVRGMVALGLFIAIHHAVAYGQAPILDKVVYRDAKDGSTKTTEGLLKASSAGFQVFRGDKAGEPIHPKNILAVTIGDLPGVERSTIRSALTKEANGEYDAARTIYRDLNSKAGLDERTKRHLEFKELLLTNRIVNDLAPGAEWEKQADQCIRGWTNFLLTQPSGWELWPATVACARLQIERGQYEDAARTWNRLSKNPNMPPEAKLEAALQEIDLLIRAKTAYSTATTNAAQLLKTATGTTKDRLSIYELTASHASSNKHGEGIAKIRQIMNASKDPTVHATGFAMIGELYLADNKPQEAKWEFLMIENVLHHDKEEVFKALQRLVTICELQKDDDKVRRFRDRIHTSRDILLE
ncbi:MAG: hypothetical protein RMJ56_12520 [Gemmataceae bacterium]|nr:hypothetical protein [Gemmata sp.]MDW8198417.1 hypothetical protein [Gemmataceae bacterium]